MKLDSITRKGIVIYFQTLVLAMKPYFLDLVFCLIRCVFNLRVGMTVSVS